MKNFTFYSFLLFFTLSFGLKAQTAIYTSAFDTQAEFDSYTLLNNGNGTRNWNYNSTKKCATYWGSAGNASAWLISPAISLEAGKTYKLTFKTWLSSTTSSTSYKSLKATVGQGKTAADQTKSLYSAVISTGSTSNTVEVIFNVDATGSWNLGFNCFGVTNSNDIYIDDVSIVNVPATPKAINNLAVNFEPDALSATITWKNPAQNVGGSDLTSLSKVELFRGDEIIYTNDSPVVGADESFIDILPLAGKYSYKIIAYNEDGASETSMSVEKWIGPKIITLPYTSSFTDSQNDFDLYTIVDVDANNKTWKRYLTSGQYTIAYTDYTVPNDWIFTPKFKGQNGTYKLTFYWRTYNGTKKESLDITIGKNTDPASHTTILNTGEQIFSSGLFSTKTIEFTISDSDNSDYYIGFHVYSPDPWGIYISDIHIENLGQSVSVNNTTIDNELLYNKTANTLSVKDASSASSLSILNLSGKTILQTNVPQSDLDVSNLSKGVYIAKCTFIDGEIKVIKFIKD